MSVQALAWAQSQSAGSGTRKAILMALANCHNHHTKRCNPRISTLAKDTEFSERTVMRALDDLEDQGIIRRVYTRWDGRQGVTRYILELDNLSDLGDGESLRQGDTESPQEPEEDLEPSVETKVSTAPAGLSAKKTPLELLWDACEEHVQRAPSVRSFRKAYAKVVRDMLEAGWTPEMVRKRARAYKRHQTFRECELSVAALAKWGEELDRGKRTLTEGDAGRNGAVHGDDGAGVPSVSVLPPEENARRMRELAERTVGALDGAGAFLSTPAPSSALPSADPTGAPGEPVHPSAGSPHPS